MASQEEKEALENLKSAPGRGGVRERRIRLAILPSRHSADPSGRQWVSTEGQTPPIPGISLRQILALAKRAQRRAPAARAAEHLPEVLNRVHAPFRTDFLLERFDGRCQWCNLSLYGLSNQRRESRIDIASCYFASYRMREKSVRYVDRLAMSEQVYSAAGSRWPIRNWIGRLLALQLVLFPRR